jgi:hypothetical protein
MNLAATLLGFVLAQPAVEGRYEQVPFDGDLNAILKQLLFRADQEQGIQRLLEQIRNDPRLKGLDSKLKGLDPNDPAVRGLLRNFAEQMGEGERLTPEKLQQLKNDWERHLAKGGFGKGGNVELPPFQGEAAPLPPPPPPPAPAADRQLDQDRLARWTRDMLQDIDETRVGDFLRDSPAWQRALERIEQTMQFPDGKLDWLDRVPDNLRLPEGLRFEGLTRPFENWSLAGRLPEFSLPRFRFAPPRLGNFNFGGGPRLGGVPALGGSVNENLFWVLVPVLLALLAFFFYRQLGRVPGVAGDVRRLGPWPVDPSNVRTRLELRQAFEYLARLLVGDQVLTWNHRAVARKLGAVREPGIAHALAGLYELARYTPGEEALPPEQQAAARRHLVTLRDAGLAAQAASPR